ncbi:MAG: EAL domain-containing protein [Anaerovoracaceae bacterium]
MFFSYSGEESGRFIFVNSTLIRMCGCESREEFNVLTGNTLQGLVHPEDFEMVRNSIEAQISEEHSAADSAEYRVLRKDGSIFRIRNYEKHKVNTDQGPVFYVFSYDAAEGHQEEKYLRSLLKCSKRMFDDLLQTDPAMGNRKHGACCHYEEPCLGKTDWAKENLKFGDYILPELREAALCSGSQSTRSLVEYDSLTGLYNLSAFYHHGAQYLSQNEGSFDLMMLDISDFSGINGIYGEKCGDEVLQFIAGELRRLDIGSMIARQADGFYFLLKSQYRMDEACVQKFCHKLTEEGPVSNLRFRVGIYQNIDKVLPVYVLCSRVEQAADSAVVKGTAGIAYYDEALEAKRVHEQWMLMVFDQALENGDFVVWLQPKVETTTGKIVAAEALVRWIDGDGKFISPGEFIPLLEREGLIWQLDEYVFRKVCDYQNEQMEKGARQVSVSVNISRNSLFREGIAAYYRSIAEEKGVPLCMVPLEITESAATTELQILEICNSFVQEGFSLHMDDFGTGYSSLSSLAMLPFDIVKLDKMLIDSIGTEKGNILLKSCVEVAQDLGMLATAEGVENPEQLKFLSLISCDMIQGYYFSPPVTMEQFEILLEEDSLWKKADRGAGDLKEGLRISYSEMKRYLKIYRMLFSTVRVTDVESQTCRTADKNGILDEEPVCCYELWGRNEPCRDCIALEVMKNGKTEQKVERIGDQFYMVYVSYIEIDGKPHVIELINEIKKQGMQK